MAPKHVIDFIAAQTKKSDQDIPTRKRKRDPSPASSDLTESPDELALKPKASKRSNNKSCYHDVH